MSASRQAYGHSGTTLAKAQSRLDRFEHGETIDQIAQRDRTSRGAVVRDLRLAREAGSEARQSRPRRRLGERAMLFRAWTVTRNLDAFRLLGLGQTMLWLSIIMQIHLNSDGDFYFGPRCRSLDELARGAGGTEADVEELISRDLLIRLEEGGIALPEDLGLRLPERVGGKTAMPPMALPRGKSPDGRQREFLMNVASNSESPPAKSESTKSESPPPTGPESDSDFAAPARGKYNNNNNVRDSESTVVVVVPTAAHAGGQAPGDSQFAAEETQISPTQLSPEDSLAAELMPLVGRVEPVARDLTEVKAWLAAGHFPDVIKARVVAHMRVRPPQTFATLDWFRAAVMNARMPTAPPEVAKPPPEPPEDPAHSIRLLHDDPDNAHLVAAWGQSRSVLRAELGEGGWHICRDMILGGLDGDEIVILLHTPFIRDQVRDRYGSRITSALLQAYPEARRIDFRISDA